MSRIGGAVVALALLAAPPAWAQAGDDTRPDPSPIPPAPPGVAFEHRTPYRDDTVELTLAPGGHEDAEAEYLVRMKAGEVMVYRWEVVGGAPGLDFYSEFHGVADGAAQRREMSYKSGAETAVAGSLAAPFDGVHGWLFKNDSDRPLKLKLTLAGFYSERSLREAMGIDGPEYMPFGPPGWPDRYGPAQK